jgi:hypothetical protein
MCDEWWEEELKWREEEEEEKVPVDIGKLDIGIGPAEIQEPAVPEAA